MTCIKPFIKRLGEEFIKPQNKDTNQPIKYSSNCDTSQQVVNNNNDASIIQNASTCSKHTNFNQDKYNNNNSSFLSTSDSPGSTSILGITDSINNIEKTSNRNLSR